MEIVKIGTNTKNAEGIKISREIRKTFETYLKAKKEVKDENETIDYEKITVELLYSSWLATFVDSEDYKAAIEAYNKKKENAKDERDKNTKRKRDSLKEQYAAQGFAGEQLEKIVDIAMNANKKGKKKAVKKATEQE